MWASFRKMMTGLVLGDEKMVVDALSEQPEQAAPCKACADKTHKDGDAPCATRADGYHCVAHGAEGACVMGKDPS